MGNMDDSLLQDFVRNTTWTGNPRSDMITFLHQYGRDDTAQHCLQVGAQARELAEQFNVLPTRAELGGWLHDISAAIPRSQYLATAQAWGIVVLPEERQCPMLLHQQLSAIIAREVFHITDEGVLSAIECHTTLKMGMLPLAKVVFLADKLAWDQPATPPYLAQMRAALDQMHSLDAALRVYSEYLGEARDLQFVAHPWFVAMSQSMEPM